MAKTTEVQMKINQWRLNGYGIHIQNEDSRILVWAAHKETEREVLLVALDKDEDNTNEGGAA